MQESNGDLGVPEEAEETTDMDQFFAKVAEVREKMAAMSVGQQELMRLHDESKTAVQVRLSASLLYCNVTSRAPVHAPQPPTPSPAENPELFRADGAYRFLSLVVWTKYCSIVHGSSMDHTGVAPSTCRCAHFFLSKAACTFTLLDTCMTRYVSGVSCDVPYVAPPFQ